ncbi:MULTISPECIES: methylmalonyl-CoA mutase subunit beta [Flavobacteriaceae]|uniref:methylmalonyl-CoA mutase subunit beta n=1 Tax=Flavobacteriaceae TaxID=49546 RepID=UPI0014921222|nr:MULTISPECIES: methylmalonyl-CoA mutase subunit beta [Allomuricauda]MDC6367573.1 methylmalonyl-CoA mutase subunit beta [Muricauda sp. AC10]
MSKLDLFDEFSDVSAKEWKQKIQVDLRGADYNETLVWESLEGIKVKPFYNAEDLQDRKTFDLPKDHNWKIAQGVFVNDIKKSNSEAINLLKKGVESLVFTIPNEEVDFETLFSGIDVNKVDLHFNFQYLESGTIKKLLGYLDGKKTKVHLNIDIIGNLVKNGNWFHNLEKDRHLLSDIQQEAKKTDSTCVLSINLSMYQNAGANMVQQLAYGLAHTCEYLHIYGYDSVASAFEKNPGIVFKVAVGSNYFFEIAKLRALRWLWKTIAPAFDISSDCHIFAVPSKRNKTLYDYNVNMLRTTSECMSAILGGADTVHNLSYDAIYHKANEFGRRIARNQLLLLKEEGYFNGAISISEGAYYIESLTRQLAEKSLELFKQLEASGGFLDALKKGKIQQKIKESAIKEQQLFDSGKIVLLGTNKFQNPDDKMKDDLELYPFVKTQARKTLLEPIIEKRLAENLEQKRLSDE